MDETSKARVFREGMEFANAFLALLREVASGAPGALHRDPLIAAVEFSSLYAGAEITSGICAAEDVGLSVQQGVACFVMLSATVDAEIQRRGGFVQRLKTKFPPRKGTRAYSHLAMFN